MNARIMKRVVAGGLWLDMVKPGWQQLIDWGLLDITHGGMCVAGQVFAGEAAQARDNGGPDWLIGYDMLRQTYSMSPVERGALGFTTDDADDQGEGDPWDDLRDAWLALWGPQAS